MNILIDTNIFIPLELTSLSDMEPETHSINELYRKAKEVNYHVLQEIFPVERRIRSIIGGLETSFGTTVWEPLAKYLAEQNGFTIKNEKKFEMPKDLPKEIVKDEGIFCMPYFVNMGEKEFRHTAGEICRALRNSQKAPGKDRIYTAGEKEYEVRLARKNGVPINDAVQKEIIAVRDELGLTQYKFPWED